MPEKNAQPGKERPTCVAVVICNEVIEDKRTNNKTLIHLFNGIATPQLPFQQPCMVVMASLTNGIGRWPVTFTVRSPSNEIVARVDGEASFVDPVGVLDIFIEFKGLVFKEQGVHFVDVQTESFPLGERRFAVQLMQRTNPAQPSE
jgi:hypothetical protein